ncbi:MAG: cupin domain-containing protein, partial [Planctomycetota bacterium]
MNTRPLTIHSCAYHECAPDWSWDTTHTPMRDHDLWTVLSGRGEVWINGGRTPVQAGSSVLFHPGDTSYASQDPGHPLIVEAIHFDLVGEPLPESRHSELRDLPFFSGQLARTREAWQKGQRE